MLGLLILAQLMDAATFTLAFHRYGYVGEALWPPVVFHQIGGIPLLIEVKLVGVLLMALIIIALSRLNLHTASRAGALAGIVAGVLGVVVNGLAVIH